MVFLPETLTAAIEHAESQEPVPLRKIYLSARGAVFNEARARELASEPGLMLVCGRYGGIDERVRAVCHLEELSVGDFILSGGELAALSVTDAVARHCPEVLGNQSSAKEESFAHGLLEHPQFTRPRQWRQLSVPEVLMGGNHTQIAEWRQNLALLVTAQNRADLLKAAPVPEAQLQAALQELSLMSLSEQKACGLFKPDLIKERLEQKLTE
jgi:tRNA (guanine37-N1)-methyltransferase